MWLITDEQILLPLGSCKEDIILLRMAISYISSTIDSYARNYMDNFHAVYCNCRLCDFLNAQWISSIWKWSSMMMKKMTVDSMNNGKKPGSTHDLHG